MKGSERAVSLLGEVEVVFEVVFRSPALMPLGRGGLGRSLDAGAELVAIAVVVAVVVAVAVAVVSVVISQ